MRSFLVALILFCGFSTQALDDLSYLDLKQMILSLPPGAPMPPAVYSTNTRIVGELLVQRLAAIKQKATECIQCEFDPMVDTKIHLYFPSKNIPLVYKNGFLNLHQISGKGRSTIEDELIGLNLGPSDVSGRLRPKYAFLLTTKRPVLGSQNLGTAWQYGRITAVLKDQVKRRATWTNADSMVGRLYGHETYTFMNPISTPPPLLGETYYEAQIWGELGASDIDYFMVPANVSAKSLSDLKVFGLPVYRYKTKRLNGQWQRTKGPLVDGSCSNFLTAKPRN